MTTNERARAPYATSAALHALLFLALFALPSSVRHEPRTRPPRTVIAFYAHETPEPEPIAAPVEPEPVAVAEVEPPPPPVKKVPPPVPDEPVVARVVPPPVERPIVPPVEPAPKPKPAPPKTPERTVHTALLGDAPKEAAAPKVERTVRTGSLAPVTGAATDEPAARAESRVVASSKFGQSAVVVPPAGKSTRPATVARSAGFGGATTGEAPKRGATEAVKLAGFSGGAAPAEPARRAERPAAAPDTPVEIVSKATPAYTDEARSLRIEGTVVLEVTFVATGELRVLRVVAGLGHGLDESAVQAAAKIRFKPARLGGRPVDHTATLRVVFQLA